MVSVKMYPTGAVRLPRGYLFGPRLTNSMLAVVAERSSNQPENNAKAATSLKVTALQKRVIYRMYNWNTLGA